VIRTTGTIMPANTRAFLGPAEEEIFDGTTDEEDADDDEDVGGFEDSVEPGAMPEAEDGLIDGKELLGDAPIVALPE